MTEPNPEQLLGYLLDALDDEELASLDAHLEQDAQSRRELVAIRRCLQPLEQLRPDYEPRPGLAQRTCRFVAKQAAFLAEMTASNSKRGMTPLPVPPCRACSFGWSDVAVLSLLLLLTVTLVFPAIYGSRFQSRVAACQNDLRQFGLALSQYGQQQRLPIKRLANNGQLSESGMLAATRLRDTYYADNRVWPSTWLAAQNNICQSDAATAASMANSRREAWSGVSFAEKAADRQYSSLSIEKPFLADAPSADTSDQALAAHGGLGRNVFYTTGRTEFVPNLNTASLYEAASVIPVSMK